MKVWSWALLRSLVSGPVAEPDERRVRDYVDCPGGMSESAASLGDKLGINARQCRGILEQLVAQGVVQRREFADIEPLYVRFPGR